jgi:hypothetical protein
MQRSLFLFTNANAETQASAAANKKTARKIQRKRRKAAIKRRAKRKILYGKAQNKCCSLPWIALTFERSAVPLHDLLRDA